MRLVVIPSVFLALAACVPAGPVDEKPKGPPIEIVEAGRALDTTRVAMRYKNGGAIPVEDENRAVLRAMEIACLEGESAIADTRTRANGILTVKVFCVGVSNSDEVIDGTRLRT